MKHATAVGKLMGTLGGIVALAVFPSCENKPVPVIHPAPISQSSDFNQTDARRLSDGATKLIAAMKRPTSSFRFSYSGRENLSADKTKGPAMGAVTLLADISPEQISLAETRGKTTTTSHAKYGDDVNWGMANLKLLRVMTNPTLGIALGASVAIPPSVDLVGKVAADKFVFDTALATTQSQRLGLERARMVVKSIKGCKGTAWIAEDSGQLIKFSLDSEFTDSGGPTWNEHYEGIVIPR